MNPDRLKKIRRAVADLDRAETAKLAGKLSLRRHDLEDLADAGTPLPAEAMAALDAWLCRAELRSMISDSRNGPLCAEMRAVTGISDAHRDAFAGGDDDALTVEQQRIATDYLIGKSRPGEVATFGGANMPLLNPLRARAMNVVRNMSDDALAAFLAEQGVATDKAA